MMRIVTWNVNSLKARIDRVEAWINAVGPDVLCLQETKMTDEAFPTNGSRPWAMSRPTTAKAVGTAWP